MNANNSIFVIYHVEGFDYEGETKTVVATRFTTEEDIEQEVSHLNNTVDGVHFPSNQNIDWKYFSFEKLLVLDKNTYESNFVFSSKKDDNLNNIGMRYMLIRDFDNRYNWFMNIGHTYGNSSLKEYLEQHFSIYLTKNIYFTDLINVAKSLYKDGLIKTNVDNIESNFNQEDLYKKLSLKFNVSIKKKAA